MKPERLEYAAPGPGQCILHNLGDRLFVQRADPVVAISHGLIRQVRAGEGHADLRLDGNVLVIGAANQEIRYRLERCAQPGYLLGTLT